MSPARTLQAVLSDLSEHQSACRDCSPECYAWVAERVHQGQRALAEADALLRSFYVRSEVSRLADERARGEARRDVP